MSSAAEIARALGGVSRNGRGFLARCPCHRDRTASLSLGDGELGLLVHCFAGCDPCDVLTELRARGLLEPLRSQDRPAPRPAVRQRTIEPPDQRNGDNARTLWREAQDPRGTLAETYLAGRELELEADLCGRVLRFHPHCPFGKDKADCWIFVPALIVAFVPIGSGDEQPVAIHRIGLRPDGHKLGKKMLGPVGGAAIKLDADESVTQALGIAEGLETALAVRATGWRPVWALGSAGAIADFPVLSGIESLTIFADNDAPAPSEWSPNMEQPLGTGEKAARACAQHWRDARRQVKIFMPRAPGVDWADEWGVR